MLEFAFWAAVALTVYAYAGYPLIAILLARRWGRSHPTSSLAPSLTVLVAAYNEAGVIAQKIENALAQDYAGELEVLVVTDGSDDGTPRIVRSLAERDPRVRLTHQGDRQGKIAALNRSVPLARGEIVVLSDANAMFVAGSLRALAGHFGDPAVAAVSGEKCIAPGEGDVSQGEGLYWRYESAIKRADSALSSVMGAAGEILAVRKECYRPLPNDTLLDDFVLSMQLVAAGFRVLYEPRAAATEEASPSPQEEFKRKVRIVAGGWQAVVRLWPLLLPGKPLVCFQYVSHRVLRWVLVPELLVIALFANLALALGESPLYEVLLLAQLAFYSAALLGYGLQTQGIRWKPLYLPFWFAFLNLAALAGMWRYLTHSQPVTWEKVARPSPG